MIVVGDMIELIKLPPADPRGFYLEAAKLGATGQIIETSGNLAIVDFNGKGRVVLSPDCFRVLPSGIKDDTVTFKTLKAKLRKLWKTWNGK